jgi:trans-aconitate methyltransferase
MKNAPVVRVKNTNNATAATIDLSRVCLAHMESLLPNLNFVIPDLRAWNPYAAVFEVQSLNLVVMDPTHKG